MAEPKKEAKDAPAQEAAEERAEPLPYPQISPQFWLDGEVQRIFTPDTDRLIPEGKLVVEFYATLRQYGIRIYMTKEAALELGKELQRMAIG